jgi:hypothetical protein
MRTGLVDEAVVNVIEEFNEVSEELKTLRRLMSRFIP